MNILYLEEALLHIDSLGYGARQSDGQDFDQDDSDILGPRTKKFKETGVLEGRKDTLKRLKKYKRTLADEGVDYDGIVRQENGKSKAKSSQNESIEINLNSIIKDRTMILLGVWDLVEAQREYITKTHYGNVHAIDALTYIFDSTYLGHKYVIPADIIGQIPGRQSTVSVNSLDLMPQKDIISFSEMSPNASIMNLRNADFANKIIYIGDARLCRFLHILRSITIELASIIIVSAFLYLISFLG
ncbi:hypothetical protein [Methanothrix sp.]|uniref:hypothetical protein n=1 Tax=Methanothrix sp. TaxID=90426 RepID=UPI003BB563D0